MGRSARTFRVARNARRNASKTTISGTPDISIIELSNIGVESPFTMTDPAAIAPSIISAPVVTAVTVPTEEFPLRRARRAAEEAEARKSRVAGRRKPSAVRLERVAAASGPGRASARRPRRSKRSVFAQLATFGAMAGVFGLLVSTSMPANALYTAEEAAAASVTAAGSLDVVPAQDVTVNAKAAAAAAETEVVARDSYEAKSFQQQITTLRGNPGFSYINNPNGTIQWPFPSTVPVSSGFGPRSVCSFCSSYHLGMDFTPGSGVPIQTIADGVVSAVNLDSGGLGNHVKVDHVINGQRVQTVYAHMQWGSVQVAVGQQVAVGTVLGKVGSTGASTGAHLHFEVHLDGTPVDPFVWLKANAN